MTPPKVPLVFRIGIVGHRPDRLKNANLEHLGQRLRELIEAVGDELRDYFASNHRLYLENSTPQIRALSPLAAGVDRIFAEQALAAGCELTAILPFETSEYEKDFIKPDDEPGHNSLERFRYFLNRTRSQNQAMSVFQLDGLPSNRPPCYGRAGDAVLNQSDLLIVVWDGMREGKVGGTEETFAAAMQRGVPVVWIDAHSDAQGKHNWKLVTQPIQMPTVPSVRMGLSVSHKIDELRVQVNHLIAVPSPPAPKRSNNQQHDQITGNSLHELETFLKEEQPNYKFAIFWKMFRDLVGDLKLTVPSLKVIPFEEQADVEEEWPENRRNSTDKRNPVAEQIDQLRPFYVWPDKLADHYADRYRSAFVMGYFAAAFAVAMALLPIALPSLEHLCGILELLAIIFILSAVRFGWKGQWHRRWLDYRMLAEFIRHQRLVAHLGGVRAAPSVPEYLATYGDPQTTWMAWYARAVERSLGLPRALVDQDFLRHCLKDLQDQLNKQIGFHQKTANRSALIEHRLHNAELTFFSLTLFCCICHLFHVGGHWIPSGVWTFCCGFFPSLGAALAGIKNQGEFRRISQISQAMSQRLDQQRKRIDPLKDQVDQLNTTPQQLSPAIATVSTEVANIMVNEVLGWRVMFKDRPLTTP